MGLILSLVVLYELIVILSINPANGVTSDSDLSSLAGVVLFGVPAFILGTILSGVVVLEGKERLYRNISKISLAITYISAIVFFYDSRP